MDALGEVAAVIGIIAGAIIGLGIIGKAVLAMLKFVRAVVRTADSLESLVPVLKDIAVEFAPNDGYSLKDTINRMDHNIHTNAWNNKQIEQALNDALDDFSTIELKELLTPPPTRRSNRGP